MPDAPMSASAAATLPGDPAPAPAPAGADDTHKVGGHIGIATPLVTSKLIAVNGAKTDKKTTTISDQFTMLVPIGIGFSLGKGFAFDFETVVATPVSPRGTTGLVVDPGVVYDTGAVVLGLRVAFQTQSPSNVGLIPLIHKGVVDLGGATGFVEAAFPTFADHDSLVFNAVAHVGVGF
jgi:hypothetical protein